MRIFLFLLIVCSSVGFSQNELYTVGTIPAELRTEANAVMRKEVVTITVKHTSRMNIRHEQIITVFNENGNRHLGAVEFYDDTRHIRSQEATLYDAQGNEIERFRRSDFVDRSAISSNDLYTDNRIKYLNFTPKQYPYTLHYISEVETSETAFMIPWQPIRGYYISTQESIYTLQNEKNIPIRMLRNHLETYGVNETSSGTTISFSVSNIPAIAREARSPEIEVFTPTVKFALNEFSLVDVDGTANDWKTFGKWQYDNLVAGLDQLPPETITAVNNYVKDAESKEEKIKRIYQFMQDRTRYISVQLGIGGWKPYPADEVDRLGYGDCKGLTNYTKALLKTQGIESYYTVVYAGEEKRDIDSEFASMQGNHVILNVPLEDKDIWLECTSQEMPFNYLGDFTDDRNVLVITPEGGTIKRTARYDEGLQRLAEGQITITAEGTLLGDLEVTHTGISYDRASRLERMDEKERQQYYSSSFPDMKKPSFKNISYTNDKEAIIFEEKLTIEAEAYARMINDKLIIQPNAYRAYSYVPKKYKRRKLDFQVQRDFSEKDEYTLSIPEGFEVDFVPEDVTLSSPFGSYASSVKKNEDGTFTFLRELTLHKGAYTQSQYTSYRDFRKDIKKYDHQKLVLKKK